MSSSLYEGVALVASAARTATGNGDSVRLLERLGGGRQNVNGVSLTLDLTNAATDAADTLNVFVQTKSDGTNWVDVVHFTEVLGNGSNALRYYSKVAAGTDDLEFEDGTALASGSVRHLLGIEWRARWAIVDSGNADQTFTFSVTATPV